MTVARVNHAINKCYPQDNTRAISDKDLDYHAHWTSWFNHYFTVIYG